MLGGPESHSASIRIYTRKIGPGLPFRAHGQASGGGDPLMVLSQAADLPPVDLDLAAGYRRDEDFTLSRSFQGARNEDGKARNNSDFEAMNIIAGAGVKPVDLFSARSDFSYVDSVYGLPPHISLKNPLFARMNDLRLWTWTVDTRFKIDDKARFRLGFIWDGGRTGLDSYDDSGYSNQENPTSVHDISEDDSKGVTQDGEIQLGPIDVIKYEVDYRRDAHREKFNRDQQWQMFERDLWSAGVENVLSPIPVLSILLGAKLERLVPQDAGSHLTGKEQMGTDANAGLTWRPTPDTAVNASGFMRTRFPSWDEQYATFAEPAANTNLNPQTTIGAELGVTQKIFKIGEASLDGFYYDISDLISDPLDSKGVRRFVNVDVLDMAGLNASLSLLPWKWLTWRVNYSLCLPNNSQARDAGLEYRPMNTANTNLGVAFSFGLEANVIFSYVDGQDFINPSSNKWDTLGGYYTVDASIYLDLWKGIRIFGMGRNLADFDYQTTNGYPEPGREVFIGVRADLDLGAKK